MQTTMAQGNCKPGHKRRGSDVTDKQNEEILDAASPTRTHSKKLHVEDKCKSTEHQNSDVVDSIGDIVYEVPDVETTATDIEDAVGGGQRQTTMDMQATVDSEHNHKQEAWKSTGKFSKDETDASPPHTSQEINSDSR
jgi:hypothetical protein